MDNATITMDILYNVYNLLNSNNDLINITMLCKDTYNAFENKTLIKTDKQRIIERNNKLFDRPDAIKKLKSSTSRGTFLMTDKNGNGLWSLRLPSNNKLIFVSKKYDSRDFIRLFYKEIPNRKLRTFIGFKIKNECKIELINLFLTNYKNKL